MIFDFNEDFNQYFVVGSQETYNGAGFAPAGPTSPGNAGCIIYGIQIDDGHTLLDPQPGSVLAVSADPSGVWINAPTILDPLEITHRTVPRDSRFELSTCIFELIDFNGLATAVVSQGLIGSQIRLWTKNYLADWSTAVTLFRGVIHDIEHGDRRYTVRARSAMNLMDREIFNVGKSKLVAQLMAGATSATVENASAFEPSGIILIESELIRFTGKVDNGSNWTLSGLTRGFDGTTDVTHDNNKGVTEAIVLGPDHPFDLARNILKGTIYPRTEPGIPDWIDNIDIDARITEIGASQEMKFVITDPINAKEFIEDQIYRVVGCYPFEDSLGLHSVKLFSNAPASVATIDEANTLDWPAWLGDFPLQVNRVVFYLDWNHATEKFESSAEFKNDGLIELFGDRPIVIQSRGLRSSLSGTAAFMSERATAIIDRFGFSLPSISAPTVFAQRVREIAENVSMTYAEVVNLTMTSLGLTNATAEIIGMRHRIREARMEFDFFLYPPLVAVLTTADETAHAVTLAPDIT